jgi:polyphosphate kinase 2 (PPK2 family)
MKIQLKDFQVQEGDKVNLKKWPTRVKPVYKSKKQYNKLLAEQVKELSELQRLHYASNRYAVLLIFQAMDAAGKDGAIRHVMSGVNPQGCQVFSFKHPSATELEHDFPVAHLAVPAGTRPHRHLQPVLLRGGIDRSRASGNSAQPESSGWIA